VEYSYGDSFEGPERCDDDDGFVAATCRWEQGFGGGRLPVCAGGDYHAGNGMQVPAIAGCLRGDLL